MPYDKEDYSLPQNVKTMNETLEYLAHKDARGKTRTEKISEHFQGFGYPISLGDPANQMIACEEWGCVFRVGVGIVMKVTKDINQEMHTLKLLSDAGLIGHPAYPVITPEDELYYFGGRYAYLLKEIVPFDAVEYVLTHEDVTYIEKSLNDLRSTVSTILFNDPKEDPEVWEAVRELYNFGKDPVLGKLADFLLQALLSDLWISGDMFTNNVGFPMSEGGEPMFEKGLVVFDLRGEEVIRQQPGLGLYVDYALDEAGEVFL